jgi:glycosyltransferase involved in cell wall biosynthesis
MSIRFSVVIPLFNKRDFISRAVGSVLSQTHRDFELIVVDDGSTDGSHEALASIADERFRLVRQANAGEGAARNSGATEAREEWVAFLDADDLWLPGHLAETAEIIAAFPDSGFVATGIREIVDICDLNAIANDKTRSNIRRADYFIEASRRLGRVVHPSCVSIRRDMLLKIGGFGPYRVEADLDCWARLALQCSFALSDKVTSVYMRGTGGITEQLWQEEQLNVPVSIPSSANEMSPSIASLEKAIAIDPALARRPGVHAYINARVFSAVYSSLARADVAAAAGFARLLTPPYAFKIAAFRVLLILPRGLLTAALRLARRVKDARRLGKSEGMRAA